jgi:hypothetical protein
MKMFETKNIRQINGSSYSRKKGNEAPTPNFAPNGIKLPLFKFL